MARKSQFAQDVLNTYLEEYPSENYERIANKIKVCDLVSIDERMQGKYTYFLSEIFFVIFCATLCNIVSFRGMETFAITQIDWLRLYLPFENGAPSHDTIRRISNMMKPSVVMAYCQELISELQSSKTGKQISIDGKAIKGHFSSPGNRLLLSVSAYNVEDGISLSQVITHNELGKEEGEYQATYKLLDMIELSDKIITTDAGMCHRLIAEKIIQGHGDYLLALKSNQPKLYKEVVNYFEKLSDIELQNLSHIHSENTGHGREEQGTCYVAPVEKVLPENILFPGQKSIIKMDTIRIIKGKETHFTRYYISSLSSESYEDIFNLIRSHWCIENSLHYVLDVTFKEDATRTQNRYGVENLLIFRRLIISLINQVKGKGTVVGTMLKACLDPNYRTHIIEQL